MQNIPGASFADICFRTLSTIPFCDILYGKESEREYVRKKAATANSRTNGTRSHRRILPKERGSLPFPKAAFPLLRYI